MYSILNTGYLIPLIDIVNSFINKQNLQNQLNLVKNKQKLLIV